MTDRDLSSVQRHPLIPGRLLAKRRVATCPHCKLADIMVSPGPARQPGNIATNDNGEGVAPLKFTACRVTYRLPSPSPVGKDRPRDQLTRQAGGDGLWSPASSTIKKIYLPAISPQCAAVVEIWAVSTLAAICFRFFSS